MNLQAGSPGTQEAEASEMQPTLYSAHCVYRLLAAQATAKLQPTRTRVGMQSVCVTDMYMHVCEFAGRYPGQVLKVQQSQLPERINQVDASLACAAGTTISLYAFAGG